MKDQLGETPATIKRVRELGAIAVFIICSPPCKRKTSVMLDAIRLSDDTMVTEIVTLKRYRCRDCNRRAKKVEVDWDRGQDSQSRSWWMMPPG